MSLSLLSFLASLTLLCLYLTEAMWLAMMLRLRESSSLQPAQNNFLEETVRCSLENSRTLLDGLADFGSVEQEGRFLRWLWVADGFFLIAHFRVSSDSNRAFRRSRSDGQVVGSLPVHCRLVTASCSRFSFTFGVRA